MGELIAISSKGAIIGFCAGIAPGPLTILVITQTLRFGLVEGVKVGIAPVITDIPIIFISLWTVSAWNQMPLPLALLSATGAIFLIIMAKGNWSAPMISWDKDQPSNPRSILQGVITNLLNPHPYLFWMTIGAPLIVKAKAGLFGAGVSFVLPMFAMMVGIKVLLAWMVAAAGKQLTPKRYQLALRGSSATLMIFALSFAWTAWQHLNQFMELK